MTMRVITSNDMHVLWTQYLAAADNLHTAMCLLDDDHAAQASLNAAMHSTLIGALQCCQLHANPMRAVPPETTEDVHETTGQSALTDKDENK